MLNMIKLFRATVLAVLLTAMAAFSADWPNWHGTDRTNKSQETGLLKSWPEGGPKLLWTAIGVGDGYSGVAVADGVIYTAGSKNNMNFVFAYDRVTGTRLWERSVGEEWEATSSQSYARAYKGARGTPTVSGGMVYYLADKGLLVALDAKNGAVKWSVNLLQRYDAKIPDYGYSESPLVIGDRLYVIAYGSKHTVVCLDKKNGESIWEGGHVSNRGSHASLVPVEYGGIRQLVSFTSDFLFSVSMDNGAVLWTIPFGRGANCADVVSQGEYIFASSAYSLGAMLVKMNVSGNRITAEKIYDKNTLRNIHGGIILHNGYVYGTDDKDGWSCVDLKTGSRMWNTRGAGSMTFAEGMLYLYDERGSMSLVRATPEKYTQISTFKVPEGGRGPYWAHPVISHGVLYLRHANNIYAYDLKN